MRRIRRHNFCGQFFAIVFIKSLWTWGTLSITPAISTARCVGALAGNRGRSSCGSKRAGCKLRSGSRKTLMLAARCQMRRYLTGCLMGTMACIRHPAHGRPCSTLTCRVPLCRSISVKCFAHPWQVMAVRKQAPPAPPSLKMSRCGSGIRAMTSCSSLLKPRCM